MQTITSTITYTRHSLQHMHTPFTTTHTHAIHYNTYCTHLIQHWMHSPFPITGTIHSQIHNHTQYSHSYHMHTHIAKPHTHTHTHTLKGAEGSGRWAVETVIQPPIHVNSSIHLSVHPSIHVSAVLRHIHPPIIVHPSTGLSVYPSVLRAVRSSLMHLSIHPSASVLPREAILRSSMGLGGWGVGGGGDSVICRSALLTHVLEKWGCVWGV